MATFAKPGTNSISAEEVKGDMDGPLPPKRKPEVSSPDRVNIQEVGDDLNKKQKLEIPSVDEKDPLLPDVESSKGVGEAENSGIQLNKDVEEEDGDDDNEEDYEDDSEDDNEDSEDDDDERSNGSPEVNDDPKGKGILKDEKGKGKLILESEDSSESGTESDGESDLSDDPLTEVDLNNILPSRTRRHAVKPGVVNISNDPGSKEDKDDDIDDDDSTC